MENYKNNVEFIKNEFGKYFVKISHEDNILQGTKYAGSHTNCRSCLYTITKMLKPNYVLEIGSYHYDTSNAISKAMDENGYGKVDSFDIKIGGVVDDIWDIRLNDVRVFFDELDVIKYDFEDWNDKHIEDDIVQNIGIISLKNK